ncbi:MAG: hypothetical protein AAF688_08635 [Bacteroidota bacterium]
MIITASLVIMMLVLFVLVFLFVKTIDERKWLSILVSLAITPFVYFYALYPMINIFTNYHHQKYFTTERWHDNPALRYEISDNMIASKILMGKSKKEIQALLGKPEWLSWNDSLKAPDKNKWNYAMGIEPGALNEDKECIEIIFKKESVTELKQYQEQLKFDGTEQ